MDTTLDKSVMFARGRLKEALIWFAHLGWDTLPQGRHGQRVLAWCAIQAWLGYPRNPEAAVRRRCGGLAPYLKENDWIDLIAKTKAANKHFNHDQCAMVLEISVIDCLEHGFKFLGADNDMNYGARHKAKRARNAACQRKRRAAHSTGRPVGRPTLPQGTARARNSVPRSEWLRTNSASQTKPWVALGISRATYYRRETGETGVTQNPVTGQEKKNRAVTVLNADLSHDHQPPDRPSRPGDARRSASYAVMKAERATGSGAAQPR
jgi:hypothetical protein